MTPQKLVEVNRRLQDKAAAYASRESWTPIQGALLLAGIQPASHFDDVFSSYVWGATFFGQEKQMLLEHEWSEGVPLNQKLEGGKLPRGTERIRDAAHILEHWNCHCNGLLDDGERAPSDLTPHAFVLWWLEQETPLRNRIYQDAFVDALLTRILPKPSDERKYEFLVNLVPFSHEGNSYVGRELVEHATKGTAVLRSGKQQNLMPATVEICKEIANAGGNPYDINVIYPKLLGAVRQGTVEGVEFVSEQKSGPKDTHSFTYRQVRADGSAGETECKVQKRDALRRVLDKKKRTAA